MIENMNDTFDSLLDDNDVQEPIEADPMVIDSAQADSLLDEGEERADQTIEDQPESTEPEEPAEEDDLITSILKGYGISDPSKIKFENEDGSVEEVNFNELDPAAQKELVASLASGDYSEEEVSTINFLRGKGLTFNEAMERYAAAKVQEYKDSMTNGAEPTYTIDSLTDDEIYIGDLKQRYPNYSDEQIAERYNRAKEDPESFAQDVAELRTQYKALEDQEMQESQQRQAAATEELRNTILQAIDNLTELKLDPEDEESDAFVLEDTDKQAIANFALAPTSSGKTQLAQDLEDPARLAELVLMSVKGKEILAGTSRYYRNELAKSHAEIKKLKEQLDRKSDPVKRGVVHKQKDISVTTDAFDKLL